jgi:hypothetical protein
MLLRLLLIVFALGWAEPTFAAPIYNHYFVGVDGLATLSSGTYSGLANPNEGRLTYLFAHWDFAQPATNHYHGIGAYSYTGDPGAPTILGTNANNALPESYTGFGPLSLVEGSGAFAGRLVSGLGTTEQDHEYGDLQLFSTQVLDGSLAVGEQEMFDSSAGRWTGSLAGSILALELVSRTDGLFVSDGSAADVFSGPNSMFTIGNGDDLDWTPLFWVDAASAGGIYSATFRLVDLAGLHESSGTFTFNFQTVPEPSVLILLASGLALLGTLRRPLQA